MYFLGGNDFNNPGLATTEIFHNGRFHPGPMILNGVREPVPVTGHCMIRITQKYSMLTGGYQGKKQVVTNSIFTHCSINL